mgnify:CR=1 FL=1
MARELDDLHRLDDYVGGGGGLPPFHGVDGANGYSRYSYVQAVSKLALKAYILAAEIRIAAIAAALLEAVGKKLPLPLGVGCG